MRKFMKAAGWTLSGAAALLSIQAFVFHYLYYRSQPLEKADAIVVFDGEGGRTPAGFKLLDEGFSRAILVSPSTQKQMENHLAHYTDHAAAVLYAEPHARTTYENAYYCAGIIRSKQLRSVILVTSANHMPRSFLLLRLLLAGDAVKVQGHPLRHGLRVDSSGKHRLAEEKALYNEMIKFWGSLYEWGYHRLTSRMAPRRFRHSEQVRRLEKWLFLNP